MNNTASAGKPPIQQQIDQALTLHKAGDLAGAEALYEAVLNAQPEHISALQLLGVLRGAQDRHEDAIALMQKSLSLKPDQPHVHANLGRALRRVERFVESEAAYSQA